MRTIFLAAAAMMFVACSGGNGTSSAASADSASDTAATAAPRDPKADTLSFAFVGDVMMGSTFPDSIHGSNLPHDDGRTLFDDTRTVTDRVDLAGLNLEGSFLDKGGHRRRMTNPRTYFIFRMPTSYVQNLVDAGFDWAGIANNHINDFGQPGRSSTMKTLREAKMAVVGLKDSCETAQFVRKGRKIGVTQFGHGDNNLDVTDLDELRRVVKKLAAENDIVLVSFHGGAEGTAHMHVPFKPEVYVGERRGNVAEFAHAAIDAGADVVFGHGPHVPRAVELYKDRLICYSLGNYCAPYRMGQAGATGFSTIAEVHTDGEGRFIYGKLHSLRQRHGDGPVFDSTYQSARLIRSLTLDDFPDTPINISESGEITRK